MSLYDFQNSPTFKEYSIHATLSAWLTLWALRHLPWWLVVPVALVIAGWKEFDFDKHKEILPDGSRGQPFANGLQDFLGYALGIALGVVSWLL
jgi:hypothetical protein